jgi:hypothetical protein
MTWKTSVSLAKWDVGGGDCNPTKPSLRNKKADTIYFS